MVLDSDIRLAAAAIAMQRLDDQGTGFSSCLEEDSGEQQSRDMAEGPHSPGGSLKVATPRKEGAGLGIFYNLETPPRKPRPRPSRDF